MRADNETHSELAAVFSRMFGNYATPGEQRIAQLQEDIGVLVNEPGINDELHEMLDQISRAGGSGNPEYASVARVFTEMADQLTQCAGNSAPPHRELYQNDACSLLIYAETAAPRDRQGRVQQAQAEPILEVAYRLLCTEPQPLVKELIDQSSMLLVSRVIGPASGRNPVTKGAPHLDTMAKTAQRALRCMAH